MAEVDSSEVNIGHEEEEYNLLPASSGKKKGKGNLMYIFILC